MNTIRQSYRHKHQVLVLQCYPRVQKNAAESKPNPSELSYLLDYTTTRPSKLQQVGSFLETRAVKDVARSRRGDIRVALRILTALMENSPPDLPLYSDSVLKILESVIRSKDIEMVEDSLSTFEVYCKHQHASSLAPDQHKSHESQSVVQRYVELASPRFSESFRPRPNSLIATRWRTVGLRAIMIILGSEMLGVEESRLLSDTVPALLENLSADDSMLEFLATLREQPLTEGKEDNGTCVEVPVGNAALPSGATSNVQSSSGPDIPADAQKVAEEEARVLAIRCLKLVLTAGTGSMRDRIRSATIFTLRFITGRAAPAAGPETKASNPSQDSRWAQSLVETITSLTPVQNRFIILDTAVDLLTQSSVEESEPRQQLALASMIYGLLSSSINLINLNVVDMLLGLLRHVLRLLQTNATQKQSPNGLEKDMQITLEEEKGVSYPNSIKTASSGQKDLVARLHQCMGSLATRIESPEQISDMVSAVLNRIQSSIGPAVSSHAVATIENSTERTFPLAAARIAALQAVKNILLVANRHRSGNGCMTKRGDGVGIWVWRGSQGLVRDESPEVRMAYVAALLTWLELETKEEDRLLVTERSRQSTSIPNRSLDENFNFGLAKLGPPVASRRGTAKTQSSFFSLLHVAIYDNISREAESDETMTLMHLLLVSLTERLGVNAVRTGLPMIARLQDDLTSGDSFTNSKARVNAESLVYGYFWALSENLGFANSRTGRNIQSEISRRKQSGLWLDKICVPALPLNEAFTSSKPDKDSSVPAKTTNLPVSRAEIVEEICHSYQNLVTGSASSPPSSLERHASNKSSAENRIPPSIKDELLADWSRDDVKLAVEKAGHDSIDGGPQATNRERSASATTRTSRQPTLKVAELKKALVGYQRISTRHSSPLRRPLSVAMSSIVTSVQSRSSSGRQSMVSVNEAGQEVPTGSDELASSTTQGQATSNSTTTSSLASHLVKQDSGATDPAMASTVSQTHHHHRLGPDAAAAAAPPPPPSSSGPKLANKLLRTPPSGRISRDHSPVRASSLSMRSIQSRGGIGPGAGKPISSRTSLQDLTCTSSGPAQVQMPTPSQRRKAQADLAALLAGIRVDGNAARDSRAGGVDGVGSGHRQPSGGLVGDHQDVDVGGHSTGTGTGTDTGISLMNPPY